MAAKIDTLFIVGHGSDNSEKATIPYVLANIEVAKPDKHVEIVMIFDGVQMALQGAAEGFNVGPPFESSDLAGRMSTFMAAGGVINVCTPCLVHRKLIDEPLVEGIVRIKGSVLLEKKDIADKIMWFT